MYLHEHKEGSSMFSDVDVDKAISIGILVVNDDQACQNKVAEVLRLCNYQVLHSGTIYDALHAIWENKERLDVVITNAQSLQTEGLAIIQNIKQKLKLNVLLIGSDNIIELKGELFSFSTYLLNGLSINCFNSLLENARRTKSISNAAVETNSLINGKEELNKKRRAVELYEERSEDSRGDHHRSKKSRVTWTNEMHQRFLDAIERLGYDKAVPKKIVEVMGVTGLTRENVASHLQKYRSSMRRTQETVLGAFPCRNTRIDFEGFASLESQDFPFCPLKFYTRIGGSHLDLVGKMRKENNSSSFVGYRFEGNKIDFGPIKIMNRDAFPTTLVVDSDLKGIHGTQPDLLDQNLFQQLGDCSHQNTPLPQMLQNLYDDNSLIGNSFDDHFDFPELDDTFFSHDD